MNHLIKAAMLFTLITIYISCEQDQGLLPIINFKSGNDYISKDTSLSGGSSIKIGVSASKSETQDVLKKFNLSVSINGSNANSIYSKDLSGSEGDTYMYDYLTKLDSVPGQKNKYIFTITNRDGLVNQDSLTITIQ
jgi:hypothetical protein